jgi:hypothetical protein
LSLQPAGGQQENAEQAKRLLEEQNDSQISHLSLQISQLKQVQKNNLNLCQPSFMVMMSC